jgi:PII-like signaling protein
MIGVKMLVPGEATLVRAFIGDDDTYYDVDGGKPLSEAIVREARRRGLAGATALRGLLGYGGSSIIHSHIGLFSEDLPVVVEIIDAHDKIAPFLPVLERMMRGGIITTQTVNVVRSLQKTPSPGRPRTG